MESSLNLDYDGRSGCLLKIMKDRNKYFIRKYSKDSDYNRRLIIQAEKQRSFINFLNFKSPKVLRINTTDNITWFDMEYIKGEKFSDYFLRFDKTKLNLIIENLISLLEYEISLANSKRIQSDIFLTKIKSIEKALFILIKSNEHLRATIQQLANEIPGSAFPCGINHGDMTLSNIIFSNGDIYLIDFLDSFIESPLNDIVKLRQDTKFYWSLQLNESMPTYHKNKLMQVLRYIDRVVDDHFSRNNFYLDWYTYLEKLNLLRILPYLSVRKEIDFVLNALN